MKYLNSGARTTSTKIAFDFSKSSFYVDGEINPELGKSNTKTILEEMGISLNESNIHKGLFVGNSSFGSGHFQNGESSLGLFFDKNFSIEVQNSEQIQEEDSTFLMSYTRNTKDTEIFFSCLDENLKKGFEFGVNNANKVFFDSYSSLGKNTFVLNNILFKKNILVVSINKTAGTVSLGIFDPSLNSIDSESFIVEPDFLNTDKIWTIGSGEYKGESGINFSSSGFPCAGYIDKFFHFDEVLTDEDISFISRSFYYDLNEVDAGFEQINGYITGYNKTVKNIVSGVVGFTRIITGYSGASYNTRSYTTSEELYGNVDAGEDFLELVFDASGLGGNLQSVYRRVTADSPTFGITGVATGIAYETYQVSKDDKPLYFNSGVSGELYREYNYIPLYSPTTNIQTSDAAVVLTGQYPSVMSDGQIGYGPRDYTYIGARNNQKDFIETIKGVNLFSTNNFCGIHYSENFEDYPVARVDSNISFSKNDVQLFINGVASQKGELNSYFDSSFKERFFVSGGDFYVNQPEGDIFNTNIDIYQSDENLSNFVDSPMVDILTSGEYSSLEITSVDQYNQSGFSEINPSGKQVFFNGQKIYEGIDYRESSGKIIFQGDLLEMTGSYFSCPDFRKDPESLFQDTVTGYNNFDIHENQCFIPDSYISYLNGIRLDPKTFIMHDSEVDLIEQGNDFIVENGYNIIYNTYVENRMYDDSASAGGLATTGNDFAIVFTKDELGYFIDENYNRVPQGAFEESPRILDVDITEV